MTKDQNISGFAELQPGTPLCNGKYIIKEKVGEGGFGITYQALQCDLDRLVCIKEYFLSGKCIREECSNTIYPQGDKSHLFEKFRQSFVQEAKMVAALHHPNIVEVIDIFDENNTSYMVMPFIGGKTLRNIVNSRGRLPYPETVNYIAQITSAVGYLHEQNILHRDIKPDNIMITEDFKAILIDFGSAREFVHDKTQAQTSMWTDGYAPPEQYTSNSRKGSYTDIYAIGATLYFALTGQVPMESAARLTERMPAPRDLVPEIPEEANRTILKAMQLKTENRHQSVQEFMDDLRNIRPSVLIDETIGGTSNKKVLWITLSVVILLTTGVIGYLLFSRSGSSEKFAVKTRDFTGMNIYPMVLVKGGTFIMGNDTMDEDSPSHQVTLDDFYIGQFEVSQKFWKKIMGGNPSVFQHASLVDSLPVENVSMEDVQVFISRLNDKTGTQFSLPTEAQWEYAARGGSESHNTMFSGSSYPNSIWYDKEGPVKIKLSTSVNELGIYQMSGNVAEWCADYYNADFYNKSKNSMNPKNTNPEKYHVVRGGSFADTDAQYVSVYYRDADNVARPYIGFRLVINN